jgi:hypothetical protein
MRVIADSTFPNALATKIGIEAYPPPACLDMNKRTAEYDSFHDKTTISLLAGFAQQYKVYVSLSAASSRSRVLRIGAVITLYAGNSDDFAPGFLLCGFAKSGPFGCKTCCRKLSLWKTSRRTSMCDYAEHGDFASQLTHYRSDLF